MKFEPLPPQKLMQQHLRAHPRAGLFVGVGLGKTASVLSVINEDFLDGIDGTTLVVAPLRVARLTWPNEQKKWDQFRWMKHEILMGQKPSGKAQIYYINYERLTELTDLSFCKRVVLDELTKVKNHQSIRANHLKKLFKDHPEISRWGLTGTPRPNSALELFAQIRMLDDGQRLSPSFNHFRSAFFTPIDHLEYNWVPKPGAEERIYSKISDLCLTLRSEDYSDVPDVSIEDVEVALPKDAHSIYKKLERDLLVMIGDQAIVAPGAAVLVNKLLQVTGGAVYDDQKAVVEIHHAKLTALQRILLDVKGPVLIATNYIHERDRVLKILGKDAVDASTFKGDIEATWNSGKIKYLVADPRSLGHGLNLQDGGHTIIWYSPTYSREVYDQFNGRIARKGQKQVPMVYRILMPGTIDDAVAEALREKGSGQHEMLRVLTEWRKLGRTFN